MLVCALEDYLRRVFSKILPKLSHMEPTMLTKQAYTDPIVWISRIGRLNL